MLNAHCVTTFLGFFSVFAGCLHFESCKYDRLGKSHLSLAYGQRFILAFEIGGLLWAIFATPVKSADIVLCVTVA